MAFQVCVVVESLWFKILKEDTYPHLSVWALALSLTPWQPPLCRAPHLPLLSSHSCEGLCPPSLAASLGSISMANRLHWAFQAHWQFGCQELGKSSSIFDDITKSTCSLFIPDRIKKQSSHQDTPPKEVGDSWSGSHRGLVRMPWARSWQAWAPVLAWKPTSC